MSKRKRKRTPQLHSPEAKEFGIKVGSEVRDITIRHNIDRTGGGIVMDCSKRAFVDRNIVTDSGGISARHTEDVAVTGNVLLPRRPIRQSRPWWKRADVMIGLILGAVSAAAAVLALL